ncbi:MAG TPA: hypothetical protein PKE30_14315 [Niabella sp.]|nr:hypothetical protein [Niabella sp.]
MRSLFNVNRLCKKQTVYATSLLFCTTVTFTAYAQDEPKKNLIGVGTAVQWASGRGLAPVFGMSYERKFTLRSSFETGLKFTPFRLPGYQGVNSGKTYNVWTVPLLYKYNAGFVNIAAGPTLNMVTGTYQPNPMFGSFRKEKGTLALGYMIKVSKAFDLTDRLVLEPEAIISGSQYFKRPQGEINVGLKYRF